MTRIAWVVVIGLVLLAVLALGASMFIPYGGRGYGGGMMGTGMMGGFGFPFMGLGMLIFWGLILAGGVWLVQALARGGQAPLSPSGRESPLDVLRVRYARGEINKEQFDQMRHELGV